MSLLDILAATKPHLLPPPARPPESPAERRDRHLAATRELADLNMLAARDAGARIEAGEATPDPTLALSRATRGVVTIVALENRIAAGQVAPIRAARDADWVRAAGLCRRPDPAPTPQPNPQPDPAHRLPRAHLDADMDEDGDDTLDPDAPRPTLIPGDGLPLAPAAVGTTRPAFVHPRPALPPPAGAHPPPDYHPRL